MAQVNFNQSKKERAHNPNINAFIAQIQGNDDSARNQAVQNAAAQGVAAVLPLLKLLDSANTEVARSAKRALYGIMHYAGRPQAHREAVQVEKDLLAGLASGSTPVKREIVRMISEIGNDASIKPLSNLLEDKDLSDDACMALQRIPGKKSLAALKKSLNSVPEPMRYPIAEALRKRGETIESYPCQKLTPTKTSGL